MKNQNTQKCGSKEKDTEKHPLTEDQTHKLLQLLDNSSNHNINQI